MTDYAAAMPDQVPAYSVERLSESGGHCDCCGRDSRTVWGFVYHNGRTTDAYWMHWTVGHLANTGANLDIALGEWGDESTPNHRVAISLIHRELQDGTPELMVIDAADRPIGQSDLVGQALRRDEVIGTPLASQVFAMVDAIYEQDSRFF